MGRRLVSAGLVGRTTEVAAIDAARARAADGEPNLVIVSGEAGVGKTRLIRACVESARADGWQVLMGESYASTDGALPFGPFTMALRGPLTALPPDRLDGVTGDGRPYLGRLIPAIADGTAAQSGDEERYLQGRIFAAVTTTLLNLAVEQPLALVIEDLHWADRSSRALMAHLIHSLHGVPILLLASLRDEDLAGEPTLAAEVAELDRLARVTRIRLDTLDTAELADLVSSLGHADLDRSELLELHRRSGGLPFYVEELLSMADPVAAGDVPPTVREIVLARLLTLSPNARSVLGAAAAIGAAVDDDVIVEVAGLPVADANDAIREGLRQALLVRSSDDRLAFRHDLVRETIYQDLLAGERRALHRAAARALTATPGDRPEHERAALLALQWDRAGDRDQALPALVVATRALLRAGAWAEAQHTAGRALETWTLVDDPAARAGIDHPDLLALAGAAAVRTNDMDAAVDRARAAVDELRAGGDVVRIGAGLERLGWYAYHANQTALSLEAGAAAIATIPADPPTAERARALSTFANRLSTLDRDSEALPVAEEALAVAQAVDAPAEIGRAYHALGIVRCGLGMSEAGIKAMRTSVTIADQESDDELAILAYFDLTWALWSNGDHALAVASVRDTAAMVERLGITLAYESMVRVQDAEMRFYAGDWSGIPALEGIDRVATYPPPNTPSFMAVRLAVARGDLAAARVLATQPPDTDETQVLAQFFGAETYAWIWAGEHEHAWAAAERGIALAPTQRVAAELILDASRAVAALAVIARLRRESARLARASERFQLLDAARQRLTATADGRPLSPVAEAAGIVLAAERATASGEPDPDAWRSAAARFAAMPWPERECDARLRAAEALSDRRDTAAASIELVAAWALAMRLGAPLLLGEIEALATRARIRLEAPVTRSPVEAPVAPETLPGDPHGLTERERQVLQLLVQGHTNRQIGELLYISPKTAGVHVSNILGKLDARNRVEAAAVAQRLGLLA